MSHNCTNAKSINKYFPWTISIKKHATTNEISLPNRLKISKSFVGLNHYSTDEQIEQTNHRRYSNIFGILNKTDKMNYSKSGDFYDDVIMLWNKIDFEYGIDKCKSLAQSICDNWLPDNEISWLIRHASIVDNVRLLDSYESSIGIKGKLHITVSHLIFLSDDLKEEKWILIHLISSIDSPSVNSMGKVIIISLKDFHTYRFVIEDNNGSDKLRLVLLKLIANVDQHSKLPCYSSNTIKQFPQPTGWILSNKRLTSSFKRMGIPNGQWEFTDINKNYKMSDTYPSVIVIPVGTSKAIMEACSKFRSRGRFPALSYYYSPAKSALCRCSQPLVGFSARCTEDITMLKRIKDAASEEHSDKLHVVDTRPKINALTNRARGKGYESEIDYEKIVFQFFQIENIHVMRSSLEKLLKACRNTRQSHLSYLDKSGWLRHIKWIYDASLYIAQKLLLGENVVVHCSDGWDRTSQVCGLTQIIIDPYYRTIEGLEDVIEKDWLSFGHKFNDRCGHLNIIDPTEISPVFTQFLDCIYQLCQNFPNQFEYNERLLRHLHRWSQDCVFGTFVGNCEKDRLDLKNYERCYSVWGYVKNNLWDYLNPYYDANEIIKVLDEPLKNSDFSFWSALYCPIEDLSTINSSPVNIPDKMFSMQQLIKSIKFQNEHLKMRANQLIKSLSEREISTNDNGRMTSSRYDEFKQMIAPDGDHNNNHTKCDGNPINKNWSQTCLEEISAVAVELPMLRADKSCNNCNRNMDRLSRTNMCYSCGNNFCQLCIHSNVNLPGHGNAGDQFPVCLLCFDRIGEYRSQITENNHITQTIDGQYNKTSNCDGFGEKRSFISNDPLMDLLLQQDVSYK